MNKKYVKLLMFIFTFLPFIVIGLSVGVVVYELYMTLSSEDYFNDNQFIKRMFTFGIGIVWILTSAIPYWLCYFIRKKTFWVLGVISLLMAITSLCFIPISFVVNNFGTWSLKLIREDNRIINEEKYDCCFTVSSSSDNNYYFEDCGAINQTDTSINWEKCFEKNGDLICSDDTLDFYNSCQDIDPLISFLYFEICIFLHSMFSFMVCFISVISLFWKENRSANVRETMKEIIKERTRKRKPVRTRHHYHTDNASSYSSYSYGSYGASECSGGSGGGSGGS
ncbi:hypothetical protein QTN25_001058 [Entamoeba marina]